MSRSSIFGWSYPPGCSGTPYDYEPPEQPRCSCGAFLPFDPTESFTQECLEDDYGPKAPGWAENVRQIEGPFDDEPWEAWQVPVVYHTNVWTCKKCGAKTQETYP